VKYSWVYLLAASLAASATVPVDDITPRIGDVEIYGARKVSVQKIRSALGAGPGDLLPSREAAEERIDKISGVVASRIEAACCEGKKPILYVGIEERDSPHVEFHPGPTGDVALPAELVDKYRAFLDAVGDSIRGRNADEDLTNGYSLMADPACRALQQSFIPLAEHDLMTIDRVIRESSDPEQRAIAAYVLQYGPRGPRTSKTVVNGLQWALRDQDDNVRENAARALKAVAVGAKLHPEQQIRIEPTWFVELMNSVVWSDRRSASLALVNLTEQRDPEVLSLIRERALPSVLEMARWHDLEHALPAFILAGRLAGLNEKAIQETWVSGDRDLVLKKALKSSSKRLALTREGP
jgi:hypothetical protein